MSTSNAGFSARELHRRQFQETAAATLDRQAGVIGQVVEAINQTNEQARVSREFVADLSTRVDGMSNSIKAVANQAGEAREYARVVDGLYGAFLRRGLLGRLRWLLTGK